MPNRVIEIFDTVVSALTGLETTGTNIKKSRAYNLPESITRALSVFVGSEEEIEHSTKVRKEREVKIVVHVADREEAVDNLVLQIEAEIWAALTVDVTLGLSYVTNIYFQSSSEIESEQGAKTSVSVEQVWLVQYTHSPTSMES